MSYIYRSTKLNWAIFILKSCRWWSSFASSWKRLLGISLSRRPVRVCWWYLMARVFGLILQYACFFIYIYIYIHVLSPYISYRKICFSLQSSSIQFMQAQDPTVKKILDFESNLCGIEGLPTCNLDKCKVSYFSSLHIHSKIAGVDQAPGISSSHTSDTPVRLSGGSKSMAWVIWW